MLIHEITPRNILSFGPDTKPIKLGKLNVLIGPNGSGKSNLLDVISVLQAASKDIAAPFRAGGDMSEWIWKGDSKNNNSRKINITTNFHPHGRGLLQTSEFKEIIHYIEANLIFNNLYISEEKITGERQTGLSQLKTSIYDQNDLENFLSNNKIEINEDFIEKLQKEISKSSALSIFRSISYNTPINYLSFMTGERIKIYRDFDTSQESLLRIPQKASLPNDFLLPDVSNLALIMNKIEFFTESRDSFIKNLRIFYDGIDDYKILIEGATAQIFLKEKNNFFPATRLSAGTLRYMCLLAILCHPNPPELICIDEPEIGLHPDIIRSLGELLIEASERTQIIVTTHSDILVDAMTDQPESVLVTEKIDGQTSITPLDAEKIKPFLEDYRLGTLWKRGKIGGNRW